MEIERTKTPFIISVLKFVYVLGGLIFTDYQLLLIKIPREGNWVGKKIPSNYLALKAAQILLKEQKFSFDFSYQITRGNTKIKSFNDFFYFPKFTFRSYSKNKNLPRKYSKFTIDFFFVKSQGVLNTKSMSFNDFFFLLFAEVS